LHRYYALQPGRPNWAKLLVLVVPSALRARLDEQWVEQVGEWATVVWRGRAEDKGAEAELAANEYTPG
jgi:hypothetical protein